MPKTDADRYRVWGIASVAALLTILLSLATAFWGVAEPYTFVDLDIYRESIKAITSGTTDTYAALPYPPVAFIAIWFLHLLPPVLGDQLWTGFSAALIIGIALILAVRMMEATKRDWRAERWMLTALTATSALLLVISMPVISQLTSGQMSLVVMALAFIDLSGVLPRRFRGVLVGVGGALKLTPLIFVAYYLATGQRRNAAVATGSFVTVTAIGWAIFPSASWQFWTHVGGSDQFGDPARRDNHAIRSMLFRISPDLGSQTWLWLLLGVTVVVLALWRSRVHFQRGEVMESFLTVGAAATVVAPIAWPHYFIWLPLLGVWLWFVGTSRARLVGGLIVLAYSPAGIPALLDPLTALHPRLVSVDDVLVLIPMAIAAFGLPHRPGQLDAPEAGSPEDPRVSADPADEHPSIEPRTSP